MAVAALEVPRDEWNALVAPGQGALRHGFIRAWQQVELASLRSVPLVERDGDSVIAAAHAYAYDLDMAAGADSRLAGPVGAVRRVWPRAFRQRVVEVGSPTPIVSPFLARGEPSEAAVAQVLRSALELAQSSRADMMIVQNFQARAYRGAVARALERHGFVEIPIPPTVVLQLPFDTFDDYVGAMRSQYRRRLRKVFERSAHLEAVHLPDFRDAADELARLWLRVFARAEELKREVLGPEFFRAAAELDYVHVLALRRPDGSIASFALLLEDEPWLHFLYTGFEREAGEQEGAYFRLIYEIARFAIERGLPSVNLGMTTLEPKLDAGGVVVPLTAWIRHRRRLRHRVYVALARGPFAPKQVAPRSVFKS